MNLISSFLSFLTENDKLFIHLQVLLY